MRRILLPLLLILTALTASAQDSRYYLYGGGVYSPQEAVVLSTWLNGRPATDLILYRVDNPEEIMNLGGPDAFELTRNLELTEFLTREVTEVDPNRSTELNLGVLPVGVYLAQLGNEATGSAVIILVSDLALVTKRSSGSLLLYTSSVTSGEPLDAELHLDLGDGTMSIEVDPGGVTLYEADGLSDASTINVAARSGSSWAFNEAWWSRWNQDNPSTYIVTDRPVYKPGQQVNIKGTTRLARSVAAVSGASVEITIDDANYEEIFATTLTTDEFGSFDLTVDLSEFAPLGYYNIRTEVLGSTSWGSFWVEEYELPEYEVSVTADEEYAIHGETTSFTVSGEYLFGGPLAGATVNYVVMSQPYSRWAWRSPYGFYDPMSSTYGGTVFARGETVLGPDGRAVIPIELQPQDQDYRLTLEASVSDESNEPVTASASMVAYRANLVLGVSSERHAHPLGESVLVTVTAQDLEGNPVATDFNLETERSYWVQDEGVMYEAGPSYSGSTDASGEATLSIDPGIAGSWAVTVSGSDDAGRITDNDTYLWIYDSTGQYWDYQYLEVSADKEEYQVGEIARFVIESPVADSWALITREGDGLRDWELVRFEGNTITYELEVRGEEVPNSYLGVVVAGDGEIYQATTAYRIDPASRFLDVTVETEADVFEPGESTEVLVTVSDAEGRPVQAQITLAVVDEAVFMIRPERVADIRAFFYGWRSNAVSTDLSTWAYFGQVEPVAEARAAMDEAVFGQAKEADAVSTGELEEARVREDFRETILWSTTVVTDSDGQARLPLEFADNLTRWRLSARAITAEGLVGQSTGFVTTTLPVLARLAMPSYLVRGDETRIRVIGQNNLEENLQATWALITEGLELAAPDEEHRTGELPALGRSVQDWWVNAVNVGTNQVEAQVLTPAASDAMRLPLPVIPHALSEELVWADQGDTSWTFELPETMTVGTLTGSLSLVPDFTAAVAPAVNWMSELDYGYTEFTVSQLLTIVLAQRSGVELPVAVGDPEEFVAARLQALFRLQHPDGGFGFGRFGTSSPVITAYVVNSLLTVQEAGYPVGNWQLQRAVDYLAHASTLTDFEVYQYLRDDDLRATATADARAYAWLALARAGRDVQHLAGLPGDPALSNQGLALSVLALIETGSRVEAELYLDELLSRVVDRDAVAYWNPDAPRYIWSDDRVETTALALQALAQLRPDSPLIARIVNWLLLERSGSHWYSTKGTAAVVTAALLLDGSAPARDNEEPVPVTVRLNGIVIEELELTDAQVEVNLARLPVRGRNILEVSVPEGAVVYSSVSLAFMVEDEFISPESNGVNVTRSFELLTPVWDDEGQFFVYDRSSVDAFTVGDFVLATITVEPAGDLRYVSVHEPLPAGLSVIEEDRSFRLSGIPRRYGDDYWGWNYWFDTREISQRSIDFYFARLTEPVTFTYILRAEHPGSFAALPSQVRLLYERDVSARTSAERLTVQPESE